MADEKITPEEVSEAAEAVEEKAAEAAEVAEAAVEEAVSETVEAAEAAVEEAAEAAEAVEEKVEEAAAEAAETVEEKAEEAVSEAAEAAEEADEAATEEAVEEAAEEVKEEAESVEEKVEEKLEEVKTEAVEEVPEKKKKKSAAGVIFTILGVILGIVIIAAVVLFFLVTSGKNPANTIEMSSGTDVIADLAGDVLTSIFDDEQGISVSVKNGDLAYVYNTKVEPKLKEALSAYGVELNDSFMQFDGKETAFYANVKYKFIDVPVSAKFNLGADDSNNIMLSLNSATVGKLTIPETFINKVLSGVEFPQGITYDKYSSQITYNLDSLNDTLKTYLNENVLKSDDSFFSSAINSILGKLIDKIDIKIGDVNVSDSELNISVAQLLG